MNVLVFTVDRETGRDNGIALSSSDANINNVGDVINATVGVVLAKLRAKGFDARQMDINIRIT